ncbi:hypothetical protein OD350_29075 (plasmid) [Clostridium beijerinckii]|uniref:hypothetical protein n=1 Tax=Clostridium beijerinckii TaxID=1520 RepID=UPI002227DB94|nr:hypothetical protein [Clostridium beijerinckii]UYZ38942.1 hypothetical protein OD350_29075 [Clostridium beijerinckii]
MKKLNMKKLNRKTIITTSLIALCIVTLVPKIAYANGFSDVVTNMITSVITFVADALVFVCDKLGGKFDKLVFNYDGSSFNSDLNLMILKSNAVSKKVLSIYGMMQYIGSAILTSISGLIVLDFVKSADNARHKVVLLGRLKRLVIALFLLNSIPTIVDVMLALNYAITDTFRLICDAIKTSSVDYGKSFLTEIFKGLIDKATGAEAFALSLAYLMSSIINLWIIIFYMIRDLSISFLLIFAPILVCFLPFRTDLIVSWFKEMFSNIITQSFQAFVFTVVVAIVSGLADGNSDLYADIYALVAFAMFIPITGMLKKLAGLEGQVGAAKSLAGVGATAMTIALAGRAFNGLKNQAGSMKESYNRIRDLKAERDNLGKMSSSAPLPNYNTGGVNGGIRSKGGFNNLATNLSAMSGFEENGGNELGMGMAMASMFTGGSKNPNFAPDVKNLPRDRNTITGEINAIRKQAIKSLAGGALSAVGGGAMAIGASTLGPMGAFAGLQVGSSLGDAAGSFAASGLSNIGYSLSEKGQDALFGKGIRPEFLSPTNGNKNWSLDNIGYNLNNMKSNLSKNINLAKSDMRFGNFNTKAASYSKEEAGDLEIRKQERQDDLTGLTGDPLRNTEYYESEKDSRLQTQSLIRQGKFAQASRYRLQTSQPSCDKNAMQGFEYKSLNNDTDENAMLYTDQNSSILFTQNQQTGERKVLATYAGNPKLKQPTMENISFDVNGNMPISDEQRGEYREQAVNLAVSKYGEDSINNSGNEYYAAAQKYIENETTNFINQHMARTQNLRNATGSGSIVINSSVNHDNVQFHNSVPNELQGIEINVPDAVQGQYSRDVYSNIEMSNINLSQKQDMFLNKRVELMQQQQYTESLRQGANELNYNRNYNRSDNASNTRGRI